jgi:hypothetical protein
MDTVFTAEGFSDEGNAFFLGVFSTPKKAETEVHRNYGHVEMRPSPVRGSYLGRWYWQNEDASFSVVIQEHQVR